MKAILVFDVDERTYEAINDYFTGVIALYLGDDRFIDFEDVMLQPMPNKKVPNGSETDEIYGCYVGWNACIDEILGEKE